MTSNLSSAVISRDKQVKQDSNRLTDCQTSYWRDSKNFGVRPGYQRGESNTAWTANCPYISPQGLVSKETSVLRRRTSKTLGSLLRSRY